MPHYSPRPIRALVTIQMLIMCAVDGYTVQAAAKRFSTSRPAAEDRMAKMLGALGYRNLTEARADPKFSGVIKAHKAKVLEEANKLMQFVFSAGK